MGEPEIVEPIVEDEDGHADPSEHLQPDIVDEVRALVDAGDVKL